MSMAVNKWRQAALQAYPQGEETPAVVGFICARESKTKIDLVAALQKFCQTQGRHVYPVLFSSELPLQQQFDALKEAGTPPVMLISKLHAALANDKPKSIALVADYKDLIANTRVPELISLETSHFLADRYQMRKVIEDVCNSVTETLDRGSSRVSTSSRGSNASRAARPFAPGSLQIRTLDYKQASLPPFPHVVKPRDSCDHANMALAFDKPGLDSLMQRNRGHVLIEQFIPHDGVIFKVFVVGSHVRVARRTSLPNAEAADPESLEKLATYLKGKFVSAGNDGGVGTVLFDSAVLTKGLKQDTPKCITLEEQGLDVTLVTALADAFAYRLGMRLFGFDVLVGSTTGDYAVVDLNLFPGYKGWVHLHSDLEEYLLQNADSAMRMNNNRRESIPDIEQWLQDALQGLPRPSPRPELEAWCSAPPLPLIVGFLFAQKGATKRNLIGLDLENNRLQGRRMHPILFERSLPLQAQFDALAKVGASPSLFVGKLHSAVASEKKENVDFVQQYKNVMAATGVPQLISVDTSRDLADRYHMRKMIEDVCDSVTLVLDLEADFGTPSSRGRPFAPGSMQLNSVDYSSERLPPFPHVVKPRDSSNHANMAIAFDEIGLQSLLKQNRGDVLIEQFVPHDDVIYKVYVVDSSIKIAKRPSLPNACDGKDTNPLALEKLATYLKGTFAPSFPDKDGVGGIGTVLFDSCCLTKGLTKEVPECLEIQEQGLDIKLVSALVDAFAVRLGMRLFGFDVLVATNGDYAIVDVNLFPGYKGWAGVSNDLEDYLLRFVTDSVVKNDMRALNSEHHIKSICADFVKAKGHSFDVDSMQVGKCLSQSNPVYKVHYTSNKEPRGLVCRLYHRALHTHNDGNHFGPSAEFERSLHRKLAKRGLAQAHLHDIKADYFGRLQVVGRLEELISGRTLLEEIDKVSVSGPDIQSTFNKSDLPNICRSLGRKIAGLHVMWQDVPFQQSANKYFPTKQPCGLERFSNWRLCAAFGMSTSPDIATDPLWGAFATDSFHALTNSKTLSSLMSHIEHQLATGTTNEAYQMVFGHFDITPTNVLVTPTKDKASSNPWEAHLIDFEWAGPNIAVYDFAKFVLSTQMLIGIGKSGCVTLEVLRDHMLPHMIRSYLTDIRATLPAATLAQLPPLDQAVVDFNEATWHCTALVAAINCFSNLVHASANGQLAGSRIPHERAKWMSDGRFNWLAHASDHFALFDARVKYMESKGVTFGDV